jgi:serine/threonine-protein kinase RsbW
MDDTADGDKTLILDAMFDSGTLRALRADVHASASRIGFPDHRVEDMVLAVHELVANAVQHGAGAGRLRIWDLAGTLHCQVDDGALAFDDPAAPAADPQDVRAAETKNSAGPSVASAWAIPGHGLWVVCQVADDLRVTSSPQGTSAAVTFNRSSVGGAAPCR